MPTLDLMVPAGLHAVSEAGSRVREFLRASGLDDVTAFQIELAIVEVITNVVRHGCPDRHDAPITMQVRVDDTSVRATIEDPGMPPPMRPRSPAEDPLAESGRGIGIVYSVMDEVKHKVLPTGNVIELTKRVSHGGAPR